MNNKTLPILLFDWDGVVVDSNAWKWEGAWKFVFDNEPSMMEIMSNVLREDFDKKKSRFDLVEDAFRRALLRNYVPEFSQPYYIRRYGDAVRNGVVEIGVSPRVEKTLQILEEEGYRMYVISMSLQEDLEYIADKLNVGKYFKALYGIPGTKKEHVMNIYAREKSDAQIVIGDGLGDRKLAEDLGCPFVAVVNEWNGWQADVTLKHKIADMFELPGVLFQLV